MSGHVVLGAVRVCVRVLVVRVVRVFGVSVLVIMMFDDAIHVFVVALAMWMRVRVLVLFMTRISGVPVLVVGVLAD